MASTIYDIHRIKKESVTINTDDRITSQKVIFDNDNNVFKGTFIGGVETSDSFLSSVSDRLSSTYQKIGNYVKLSNDVSASFSTVKISCVFEDDTSMCFYALSTLNSI